jgi:hypothetical protein
VRLLDKFGDATIHPGRETGQVITLEPFLARDDLIVTIRVPRAVFGQEVAFQVAAADMLSD